MLVFSWRHSAQVLGLGLTVLASACSSVDDEKAQASAVTQGSESKCSSGNYGFQPSAHQEGDTATFRYGNALLLGEASFMAYFDPEYTKDPAVFQREVAKFKKKATEEYGFLSFGYIDRTSAPSKGVPKKTYEADTQFFFLRDLAPKSKGGPKTDVLTLVFRGTESTREADLRTNSKSELVDDSKIANITKATIGKPLKAHAGFLTALDDLWDERIIPIVNQYVQGSTDAETARNKQTKPIVVSGHSLGGALAQLTALRLRALGYFVSDVYTYGAPAAGTEEYQELYNTLGLGKRTFRFVNHLDIVPVITCKREASQPNWLHVGTRIKIEADGSWTFVPNPVENLFCDAPGGFDETVKSGMGWIAHKNYVVIFPTPEDPTLRPGPIRKAYEAHCQEEAR